MWITWLNRSYVDYLAKPVIFWVRSLEDTAETNGYKYWTGRYFDRTAHFDGIS